MNGWFRSWHGAPTDPKWLFLAAKAGVRPCHVAYTWWALLDHASQCADRGYVGDFDQETFAHFAGLEASHVSRIVTTLSDKGLIVDGKIANWGKRQPKREDETAGDRKRRQRAKNGGNPPDNGGDNTPDHTLNGSGHAMSRNVTPDKDKIRDNSVANATGTVVPHPATDFCAIIFGSGLQSLVSSGMSERNARSLLGRVRKKLGDPETLVLLRRIETDEISQPAEYLGKAMENANGRVSQGIRGGVRSDPLLAAFADIDAQEESSQAG